MKTPKYIILVLFFQLLLLNRGVTQDCSNLKVLVLSKSFTVKTLPIVMAQDVMWHRRLWREIDLNENVNQHLYLPKKSDDRTCSLFDIFFNYILKGYVKAYDPNDDMFTKELSINEIQNLTGDSLYDENGDLTFRNIKSKDVVKFWLKEDWSFDSKYSKIDFRIIGICHVKYSYDENGQMIGYKQLFWLYYPNIRSVLVNHEAIKKEKEDDQRVSFDDVFLRRIFNSYIIIKTGDKVLHVDDNKTGLDIKLENEKTRIYYWNNVAQYWRN